MENTDKDQRPTPHFTPSIGRQVLYALMDDQAQVLTELRRERCLAYQDDEQIPKSRRPVPITFKAGERIAATIVYVHPDGLCDLALMVPIPDNFQTCNTPNAYGPGGYLYFNQVRPESPKLDFKHQANADGTCTVIRYVMEAEIPTEPIPVTVPAAEAALLNDHLNTDLTPEMQQKALREAWEAEKDKDFIF